MFCGHLSRDARLEVGSLAIERGDGGILVVDDDGCGGGSLSAGGSDSVADGRGGVSLEIVMMARWWQEMAVAHWK